MVYVYILILGIVFQFGDDDFEKFLRGTPYTMNHVYPTQGKKAFLSPFSVHIVCELPLSYN